MGKLLTLLLVLQLLGWVSALITRLYSQPFLLFIALIINVLIWICVWKGTNFVVSHPEVRSNDKKITLIRWVLSFLFSILAMEVGIIVAFILRFFTDRSIVDGNLGALVGGAGFWYGKIILTLGILTAIPIQFFIGKSLKF